MTARLALASLFIVAAVLARRDHDQIGANLDGAIGPDQCVGSAGQQ